MRKIRNYILMSLVLLGIECKVSIDSKNNIRDERSNIKINAIQNEKKNKILKNKAQQSDTLNISIGQSQILAFSMTQDEYDKLSEDAAGEYAEGYGDMIYYLEQFSNMVSGKDILIRETASRYIKIGSSLINRKTLDSYFGLIFITKKGNYEIVNNGLLNLEIQQKAKSMNPPLISE